MKVLRIKDVCERTGLKRAWLYRLEGRQQFPARVELGPNAVGWIESEVDEWIAARPRRSVRENSAQSLRPEV